MKPEELRAMDINELKKKEQELKKELFNMRIQHSMGQLENPVRMRLVKKDIARVKTIIREKELKEQKGE
ncbi:MAG TPA: 50S ribosomal protein L29 [Deltaproteobacteria bacterium]|nr:50S ribosomal protein L29 [Deltaproteobacteria bacterium]